MAQIRNYSRLAEEIIREVGGKENIIRAARCATRLRLELRETPKGAKARIAELPGVITVAESGGQFQVVIGTHVGDVYEAAAGLLNLDEQEGGEAGDIKPGDCGYVRGFCAFCVYSGGSGNPAGHFDSD